MQEDKGRADATTVVTSGNNMLAGTSKKRKEIPHLEVYRYGMIPSHLASQYYMDREKELYERALKLKGMTNPNVHADVIATDIAMAPGPSTNGNDNGIDNRNGMEQKDEKEDKQQLETKEKSKIKYRYTLEEMKQYNPYRHSPRKL